MAKDTRKKPKHTSLVVPGSPSSSKERKNRDNRNSEKEDYSSVNTDTEKQNSAASYSESSGNSPQSNTIRIDPTRIRSRTRIRKRVRNLLILALAILTIIFFSSGAYLTAGVVASEVSTNIQIALQPGDGFPTDFSLVGFRNAKPMGDGGFAVLGDRDLVIISSAGRELLRVQHGFVNPQITTSKNRVCVYNRGGRDYVVEGRTEQFMRGTTQDSIQFAQLSPNGWLALCTSARSRYDIAVYDSTITGPRNPRMTWSSVNDIPLLAQFHSNNKTMAIGCISAKDGSMGSTIYLLRIDRPEDQVQTASIRVEGAIPVQLHFLSNDRLLVLYNTGFAALYDENGEELTRFSYQNRRLISADYSGSTLALLFGAAEQDSTNLVILNNELKVLCEVLVPDISQPQVLSDKQGAYIMGGREIRAFSLDGAPAGTLLSEEKNYGIVYGGRPLLITASSIKSLDSLFQPDTPGSALPPPLSEAVSSSLQSSAPVSS